MMSPPLMKIQEAIVVEGRYDKNTLSQVVDTVILDTAGFGVFKDAERLALLRRLAANRGLIILTDSDGAGFVIRNHLKGVIRSNTRTSPMSTAKSGANARPARRANWA